MSQENPFSVSQSFANPQEIIQPMDVDIPVVSEEIQQNSSVEVYKKPEQSLESKKENFSQLDIQSKKQEIQNQIQEKETQIQNLESSSTQTKIDLENTRKTLGLPDYYDTPISVSITQEKIKKLTQEKEVLVSRLLEMEDEEDAGIPMVEWSQSDYKETLPISEQTQNIIEIEHDKKLLPEHEQENSLVSSDDFEFQQMEDTIDIPYEDITDQEVPLIGEGDKNLLDQYSIDGEILDSIENNSDRESQDSFGFENSQAQLDDSTILDNTNNIGDTGVSLDGLK